MGKELKTSQEGMVKELHAVLAAVKEMRASMYDFPRTFTSVATGLREAGAGGPVRALVAASRDDLETWLMQAGFKEYVPVLAPLGGAALLLQTEASLVAAGVAPHHAKVLLMKLDGAVYAPRPDAHAGS